MDPLKTYDYLAVARRRLLDWVRPLTPDQYAREFPIGLNSLARTLTHIMSSEWYYIERMRQADVPPHDQWAIRDEIPPSFPALEAAWTEQAGQTRATLAAIRDWSTELEYQVTDDSGCRLIINASPSDIFTQLVLHEVHHRAQAMNMLRQLGVPASDLDYNALMYKRRPAVSEP